jgi:hypothetical protein
MYLQYLTLSVLLLGSPSLSANEFDEPVDSLPDGQCQKWSTPEQIGSVDHNSIPEASGIAQSNRYPWRLYHMNDSGDSPRFFTTMIDGSQTKEVMLEGVGQTDYEDLSVGKCWGNSQCLFIADLGNNFQTRKKLKLIVVKERQSFSDSVAPEVVVRFKYPDGKHNAEGMAIHPITGDIYFLSKPFERKTPWKFGFKFPFLKKRKFLTSKLYKMEREEWEKYEGGTVKLKRVGKLRFYQKAPKNWKWRKSVATSLDISPDGKRFMVLTYEDAYEYNFDLSEVEKLPKGKHMEEGIDYTRISLTPLKQQEGVTYIKGPKHRFIYDSEEPGDGTDGPIMLVECIDENLY